MDIKEITEAEALALLDSPDQSGSYVPRGLFWHRDSNCGYYIAIDNSGGDALVEEFETLENCLKYLRREPCVSVSGFTY